VSAARTQVYSTALPSPAVAAASAALRLAAGAEGQRLRRKLWGHVGRLNVALGGSPGGGGGGGSRGGGRVDGDHVEDEAFAGLAGRGRGGAVVKVQSPIAAVVFGAEAAALAASAALLRAGLHVPAIRPPTVPAGTARLRVALSAAHSDADLAALIAALGKSHPHGGGAAASL
jgi:8-amino-7-oxononanoate synthase